MRTRARGLVGSILAVSGLFRPVFAGISARNTAQGGAPGRGKRAGRWACRCARASRRAVRIHSRRPPTAVSNNRNKSNNRNTILEHLQQPPGVEADTFDAGPMRSRTRTARRRILRGTPTAAPVPGDRRSRGELAPTGWPDVPAAGEHPRRVCLSWPPFRVFPLVISCGNTRNAPY